MRIVIAEDSAVVRAGLAEILADRGHEVVAAVGNADDLLAAVSAADQLQDLNPVGLPGPVGHAAELLGGQTQLHGDRDHLRLRSVV